MVQLHNASDALIWVSYIAIPILLVFFAWKKRDLPFPWLWVLFGAFIIGCGFTHFIGIVTFYRPIYRFDGLLKLITAIVSLATVVALIPVLPKALALRSPLELQREIDERVRVETQLRIFTIELERSNRELQSFASVASHDLQEPLRKIQAFGDRLSTKYTSTLGPEGVDYLRRMLAASDRMRVLIEDLLTFSRVSSNAQPFGLVRVEEVAAEVVEDLSTRIATTGGRVTIEGKAVLQADRTQIRQLLQNLIGNGLKFHREGVPPEVSIEITVRDEPSPTPSEPPRKMCDIAVQDNGIGFEEKYLDRIFNLFQRLHGRGEYEGTGMGLAICRKIAERHEGRIDATSTLGSGSRFVATIPVRQTQHPTA